MGEQIILKDQSYADKNRMKEKKDEVI